MGGRLLIASNRLPVTLKDERGALRLVPSSGGLATALRSPHERSGGLWFGWPGDLTHATASEKQQITEELTRLRTAPLAISPREVASYYDGFSNGVLWPLLHYMLDKVRLDAEHDFSVYKEINRRFAEAIAKEHKAGDVIWVQDYQLCLVPGYLRKLLPHATIGFFLHVPFPSAEVFRILPWREEILKGLLGADLIGFHTAGYRHNFAHAAALVLGLDLGVDTIAYDDRTVRIGVYPIGVDAASFEEAAGRSDVRNEIEKLRASLGKKRLVLGIDRLDYTKGIPRRLLAIDRLLSREPRMRDEIHFLQVAVPTREKVEHYSELRRTVNELVGRLNSHHGSPSGVPIHFLYRSIPFAQLAALYRAADVMLVTPLRDGMNLVAKEYVATRTDDQGVLVLSELAGAADGLPEALTVNPYDLGGVARATSRALEMSSAEQRLRMMAMRARVRRGNVHAWAEGFIADLEVQTMSPSSRVEPTMTTPPADLSARIAAARVAPTRMILLDYDGTLMPLAPLPELAAPDTALLRLLGDLARLPSTEVHILTGRTRASIEQWVGQLPIMLHAEHGFWSRWSSHWVSNHELSVAWKEKVEPLFADFCARTPGAFVEEKTAALALHYRSSDPTLVAERLRELRGKLTTALSGGPVEMLDGSKVLEVRLRGANKGVIARKLTADLHPDAAILAAGDDRTDEDTFAALPEQAITIRVGPGRSRAAYTVASPAELRGMLRILLEDPTALRP
ncbi:MAG: bifunctional alpha,alpha-trehalose-phosphate synthase (UDP-forming)/trehalose-phosphatase [Polyangiaceae bacterium]